VVGSCNRTLTQPSPLPARFCLAVWAWALSVGCADAKRCKESWRVFGIAALFLEIRVESSTVAFAGPLHARPENVRLNGLLTVATSGTFPQNVNRALKSAFISPFLEGIEGFAAQVEVKDEPPQRSRPWTTRPEAASPSTYCDMRVSRHRLRSRTSRPSGLGPGQPAPRQLHRVHTATWKPHLRAPVKPDFCLSRMAVVPLLKRRRGPQLRRQTRRLTIPSATAEQSTAAL